MATCDEDTKPTKTLRGGRSMSSQTLHSLNDLRLKKLLCDATIRLDGGVVFHVHRAVLSSSSDYFRALFTTLLHQADPVDTFLKDFDSTTISSVIEFIYLRNIELTPSNVFQIYVAADYLGVISLINVCISYMTEIIDSKNCVTILTFARRYFNSTIEKSAWTYIMRYFPLVARDCNELLELPFGDFEEIAKSDELNVKSEQVVWRTIVRWVERDEKRKKYVPKLLRSVRLGLLDTQYFIEEVKEHCFVMGNEGCRPVIIETLKFLYDLEMINGKCEEVNTPELARPRVPHEILFAVGGWTVGNAADFIETYDTRSDRWVRVRETDPAGPRAYHKTAVVGHCIYVIGGFDGMTYFNSCRRFDVVTKKWSEVAPMNCKRCYVSIAVLDNIIYAIGGYNGHRRQESAEKYDCTTNQWLMIANMNEKRSDASAAALNGKIYVTGGFNGQECLSSAEVYNPKTDEWTTIANMRCRRSGVSCISYNNCIYVLGGFNGMTRLSSGEKYDPITSNWFPIPDMYNQRSNFAIEVIDEMVFAIGGFNGITTISHVECFDQETNEWYEATDMNICRSALSACVVMGLPNVNDYVYKHRDKLVEEKRQKLWLAAEHSRHQNNRNSDLQRAAVVMPQPYPLNVIEEDG